MHMHMYIHIYIYIIGMHHSLVAVADGLVGFGWAEHGRAVRNVAHVADFNVEI